MAILSSRTEKENRTFLPNVIPIDTPYVLGIYTGDVCNFKCKYCIQSSKNDVPQKKCLKNEFMSFELFRKVVDSAKIFPQKIKKVLLSSIGEPLLNKDIVRMIRYMNSVDLADEYEIVTNGSLLTKELSKQLIDAGLSRLCISVQGLTAEKYLDVCGYKIDYNYFYDNIKFFYEYGRGKCRVHIKTVDMALDDGEDALFFNTFKAYCDTINIDRIVPVFQGVDYENIMNEKEKFTVSRYEEVKSRTCEKIFYTLFVLADGTIAPCCDSPQPLTYGNIQDISLLQAWNGDRRRDFMIKHLKGMRCENSVCANCYVPLLDKCPQDILDGYEKVILKKI